MKSYEHIAAAIYHAYCKSLNVVDQPSTQSESWAMLNLARQQAWIAAAKQAAAELALVH